MRSQLILLFSVALMMTSCIEPGETETVYEPILMPRTQLENSISFTESQPIIAAGKMMLYQDLYFVLERRKGIHVFDVSDVDNPDQLGFIQVPGCMDIIAKDGHIYVDNAVDLVTLKWEHNDVVEVDRQRDVFEPVAPPQGVRTVDYTHIPEDAVIVGWRIK